MRKEPFTEDVLYHIYDRGVDKRDIFLDINDRIRFVHALYLLNNFLTIPPRFNFFTLQPRTFLTPRDPLVEIAAACLMPNHYHLLLKQKKQGSISMLFQKFGTSYTKYFNAKHERTGRLFESTFKAKTVHNDEALHYVGEYIHLNPVKLFAAEKNSRSIFQKTIQYPWSSLPDYLGRKSRVSILLSSEFLKDMLDLTPNQYKKFLWERYIATVPS